MLFISKEVKVLLNRMDTNPEEFNGYDSKWEVFFPRGSCFDELNMVEKYAVKRKLLKTRSKLYRRKAYERIMTTLIAGERSENEDTRHYMTQAEMMRAKIHADMMREEQDKLQLEIMKHNIIKHMEQRGQL